MMLQRTGFDSVCAALPSGVQKPKVRLWDKATVVDGFILKDSRLMQGVICGMRYVCGISAIVEGVEPEWQYSVSYVHGLSFEQARWVKGQYRDIRHYTPEMCLGPVEGEDSFRNVPLPKFCLFDRVRVKGVFGKCDVSVIGLYYVSPVSASIENMQPGWYYSASLVQSISVDDAARLDKELQQIEDFIHEDDLKLVSRASDRQRKQRNQEKAIVIPGNWDAPKFGLMQRVAFEHDRLADVVNCERIYEPTKEVGVIVGLQYQLDDEHGHVGWQYTVKLDEDSPSFDRDSVEVISEAELTLLVHQSEPIAA